MTAVCSSGTRKCHLHCEHERGRWGGLVDGDPADRGAVGVMEVGWPSGAALRGVASNHPRVHWLKTVVLSVVGDVATRSRQVGAGRMSDGPRGPLPLTRRKAETTSKPGPCKCLGISLGATRLLPRRRPAYRQHDPGQGASTERVKACPDTAAVPCAARGRPPSGGNREEPSTVAGRAGGLARSSREAAAYRSGGGAKGRGRPGERMRSTVRDEPRA